MITKTKSRDIDNFVNKQKLHENIRDWLVEKRSS